MSEEQTTVEGPDDPPGEIDRNGEQSGEQASYAEYDVPGFRTLLAGAVSGTIGGSFLLLVGQATAYSLFVYTGLGIGVSFFIGHRATDPGRGFFWGLGTVFFFIVLAFGLCQVLPTPIMRLNRPDAVFPLLIEGFLGLGAPVGIGVGLTQSMQDEHVSALEPLRGILVGALAGLMGGWVFSHWMETFGLMPEIAQLIGSDAPRAGRGIHFSISLVLGSLFGLLFQRDARGYGSSMVWGLGYGCFWWFLGGLTLFPFLLGGPVEWSIQAASAPMGSFVGHGVYGLLVGLFYSLFDRTWLLLFHESDPLNRSVRGPGVRVTHAMGLGAAASLTGAFLFGLILWHTGKFETIARLVGRREPFAGVLVHAVVGTIIGMTYGFLFRYESPDPGYGIMWGLLYGLIWWYMGPLTLMPVLLGQPLAWEATAVKASMPMLIGHLVYGVSTGAVFYAIEARYRQWEQFDERIKQYARRRRRKVGTPAPAVWLFNAGMGTLVVVMLFI